MSGPYRELAVPVGARPCPRCHPGAPLAQSAIGQTPLLECGECKGVWLRAAAYQDLLIDVDRQQEVLAVPADPPEFEREVRYLRCPECAQMMARKNLARSGLMVDICPRHGIWLDNGELRRVVELIAAGKLPEPPREPEPVREPHPIAAGLMNTEGGRQAFFVRIIEWLLSHAPHW